MCPVVTPPMVLWAEAMAVALETGRSPSGCTAHSHTKDVALDKRFSLTFLTSWAFDSNF